MDSFQVLRECIVKLSSPFQSFEDVSYVGAILSQREDESLLLLIYDPRKSCMILGGRGEAESSLERFRSPTNVPVSLSVRVVDPSISQEKDCVYSKLVKG